MNSLVSELTRNLSGELSCPACGSYDVHVLLHDHVSKNNPLGEKIGSIQCHHEGCQLAKDVPVDQLKEAIKQWMISEVTTYRCFYSLPGDEYTAMVPSIPDISQGFWINKERKYTQGSDGQIWIPPGQVQYVEKTTEERRLG